MTPSEVLDNIIHPTGIWSPPALQMEPAEANIHLPIRPPREYSAKQGPTTVDAEIDLDLVNAITRLGPTGKTLQKRLRRRDEFRTH